MLKLVSIHMILMIIQAKGNTDTDIIISDILRNDLMPTSFFLPEEKPIYYVNSTTDVEAGRSANGSVGNALVTMSFHRKMMNEYLCRNFLAEKILEDVEQPVIKNRIGRPFLPPGKSQDQTARRKMMEQNMAFLGDEGSTNYKDWLAKVTTLEDIYRHHGADNRMDSDLLTEESLHEPVDTREGYEVYEGGELTGYDVHTPPTTVHKYGGGYEAYPAPPYYQPPQYHQPSQYHQPASHPEFEVERDGHGSLGLGDLFEISLTGLAFLSFGMFVLQVLMCISMNKQTTTMQMVDGTGDAVTLDENFRFRRWASIPTDTPSTSTIPSYPTPTTPALNEMSRRALRALRPFSDGTCLHLELCRGNRYARNLTDGGQYWLPIWNLGISWVHVGASLPALRAAALGLGGADCDANFGTDCSS